MPLPHRINITSGGMGDDPGEMLYGCQVDRIDGPPGSGSRGFSPGEDALSKTFNRVTYALAQNDEYIGDIIVKRELAYKEVGALTAFSANNIKIDPSGGAAGNVNYTGDLYLGEAGWTASQENLDSLFQLLDENYNEVIVDGVEVKVTSIQAPRAVGDGFVATITQLNLNKTVPSANYRIAYGRGTTLENIPPYSLIGADIRGLHEAAGETNRKAFVVCTPAGGTGDFAGTGAVEAAIAAYPSGNVTIFIRNGTYSIASSVSLVVPAGVSIIGEAADAVILEIPVSRTVSLGLYNRVSNIQFFAPAPDGSQQVRITGSNCCCTRVSFVRVELYTNSAYGVFDEITLVPYDRALYVTNANGSCFRNVTVSTPSIGGATELVLFDQPAGAFDQLLVSRMIITGSPYGVVGLRISGAGTFRSARFENCSVTSGSAAVSLDIKTNFRSSSFENCWFYGPEGVASVGSSSYLMNLSFLNCRFENLATSWYRTCPFDFITKYPFGVTAASGDCTGIHLENCYFKDHWSLGNDDAADPPGPPAGGGYAYTIMYLRGVSGQNIVLDRSGITYNIEDGTWLELYNCTLDRVTVVSTGAMVPYLYGTASHGIIRILGQSTVRDLKFTDTLVGEVNRSVVYVTNPYDYVNGDCTVPVCPAVIDGLQIGFDDGTAFFNSESYPIHHGLLLTMDGNAIVRRFVMSNGVKFQVEDSGDTNRTKALILLRGQYNTFEDFQIYLKSIDQGTVEYILMVNPDNSGKNDHGNIVQNGKMHVEYLTVNGTCYPIHHISVYSGAGVLINNVDFYLKTPAANNRVIYVNSFFARVVNNHIDVDGNCDLEDGLISFDCSAPGAGPAETCTCIGNIIRCRSGTAVPTIFVAAGGALGADLGNVLIKLAAPVYPSE